MLSMNKLAERIQQLRKSKNLRQKELAGKISVTAQAVSMWEAGIRSPNPTQRQKLCSFFNITEAELFGAISNTNNFPVQKIPVISWIHANKFEQMHDPFPVGVADDYVYANVRGKNIFALKVTNDCMEPEFSEGCTIIINPTLEIKHNDYVIIADRDDNSATFKQYKVYGNKRILHPLNPKYLDIELDHKKRYYIIGRVVAKTKSY